MEEFGLRSRSSGSEQWFGRGFSGLVMAGVEKPKGEILLSRSSTEKMNVSRSL